jgi:hypothetical protein
MYGRPRLEENKILRKQYCKSRIWFVKRFPSAQGDNNNNLLWGGERGGGLRDLWDVVSQVIIFVLSLF